MTNNILSDYLRARMFNTQSNTHARIHTRTYMRATHSRHMFSPPVSSPVLPWWLLHSRGSRNLAQFGGLFMSGASCDSDYSDSDYLFNKLWLIIPTPLDSHNSLSCECWVACDQALELHASSKWNLHVSKMLGMLQTNFTTHSPWED